MRAAVCRDFGEPLTVEEVQLDPPGAGQVRVDLAACAICHSDITYLEGGWGGDLPAVFGHEAAGTVAETGTDVSDLGPGDRVVVTLIRSCGSCRHCLRGEEVACSARWPADEGSPLRSTTGEPIGHGLHTAAFAEQVVVERSQLVPVDAELPLEVAALLGCGVITGVGAVRNTADVRPGDTVVVIGCGGVGLNAVQGAALSDAERVVAVDLNQAKLDAACEFGATHVVNSATHDLEAEIEAITGGRRADWVLVTVGAEAAFTLAHELLAPFGAVVFVGMPVTGVTSTIDPTVMASRSQRILGSKMGGSRISVDVPELIELYRAGRIKLDELITARYPLEEINEAIGGVRAGEAIRNLIVFDR